MPKQRQRRRKSLFHAESYVDLFLWSAHIDPFQLVAYLVLIDSHAADSAAPSVLGTQWCHMQKEVDDIELDVRSISKWEVVKN